MKAARWLAPILALLFIPMTASAGIIFSAITVTPIPSAGELTAGASWMTSGNDIEFDLPNAVVGDNLPSIAGTFSMTYEAVSTDPLTGNALHLANSAGLALSGTGKVVFDEVIESLDANPLVIASYGTTIAPPSGLPLDITLNFTQPAFHIKVKKTVTLLAPPSIGGTEINRAAVNVVSQHLVPEPASLLLLGLGALVSFRRR